MLRWRSANAAGKLSERWDLPRAGALEVVRDAAGSTPIFELLRRWDERSMFAADGDISASELVSAMDALLWVLDSLGSGLRFARRDLESNVQEVKRACGRYGAKGLAEMVGREHARVASSSAERGEAAPPLSERPAAGPGAENLVWVKRTLQFTNCFLTGFLCGAKLGESASQAYRSTLYFVHPKLVRSVAAHVLRVLIPDGSVFCRRIYPSDEEIVRLGMRELLLCIQAVLRKLVALSNEYGLEPAAPLQEPPPALPQRIFHRTEQ